MTNLPVNPTFFLHDKHLFFFFFPDSFPTPRSGSSGAASVLATTSTPIISLEEEVAQEEEEEAPKDMLSSFCKVKHGLLTYHITDIRLIMKIKNSVLIAKTQKS